MTIGNNAPYMGYDSLVGIGKETTFGTFVTATCHLEFTSESIKHTMEEIKIEALNGTRDFKKRLLGNTTVGGSLEAPFNIASDACIWLFRSALGGTSTVVAGSSSTYVHTMNVGDLENTGATSTSTKITSLSVSVRPGASGSKTWNFYGCRVNSFTLKGETGSPVAMTAEIMGKGCSLSSTLPAASFTDVTPVNFVGVTVKTGDSIGNVSAEYFGSFELSINNNINGDMRVLGSREVFALPAVMRDVTVKLTQIYDTATAYDRFVGATQVAIQILLDSLVNIATATSYSCIIDLPRCYLNSNNPSVSEAGPVKNELEFRAMWDSATGYCMKATVTNKTASYD
jgi:hypothetical protein